ncbi:P-loop NTPase fold protein [Serratia marcescens]|uniref:P-loop NTPase fold protein n=1 Tax=Serratia marcescens TaxID=615 RepID=UPI0020A5D202|nr:P-loop NTPase fold protein [Serratia marcescens]
MASLLLPVAAIVAEEEERRRPAKKWAYLRRKKALTDTARVLMDYIRATARNLTPVAKIAALIPDTPDVSGALGAADSSWLKEKEKTTADMRTEIARKIEELDLSFIVLLDDLDRLEPAQAVEVIRLVKSVANFPRFRYLLCYDKAVLSQAISQGWASPTAACTCRKLSRSPSHCHARNPLRCASNFSRTPPSYTKR